MARRSLLVSASVAVAVAGCAATRRPAFDAARLQAGRFAYQTTLHGADAGTSTISIDRPDPGTVRFRNEVTGAFRQTWEATATLAMQPRSASLGLGPSDDRRRTMRLAYASDVGLVTGATSSQAGTEEVSAKLPSDIVDQRIDWAALMSAPLDGRGAVAFHVYDPWTGISSVAAEVGDVDELTVPAGSFRARHVVYRIEKSSGGERYEIWVSEAAPRVLLREDFPNGATTVLTSAGELAPDPPPAAPAPASSPRARAPAPARRRPRRA